MQISETIKRSMIFGLGAAMGGFPGARDAYERAVAETIEREKISIEYRMLTGSIEIADALTAKVYEKAKTLAVSDVFEFKPILTVLHDEVRRRLAYGMTPAQLLQTIEDIRDIDDLRKMAIEKVIRYSVSIGGRDSCKLT